MLEEWLYLQPRGKNRGRKMDGENGGGVGCRGTVSSQRRRVMESEWKGGGSGEGRTERREGQVVMNVLLFTAHCLQYGCGRM